MYWLLTLSEGVCTCTDLQVEALFRHGLCLSLTDNEVEGCCLRGVVEVDPESGVGRDPWPQPAQGGEVVDRHALGQLGSAPSDADVSQVGGALVVKRQLHTGHGPRVDVRRTGESGTHLKT